MAALARKSKPTRLLVLLEEITAGLAAYPNLHAFIEEGRVVVRGTFPVRSTTGKTLDRFSIQIEITTDYPETLPILREVGGRIPRVADRHHMNPDGTACALLPFAREEIFPIGAPFAAYLDGPVRDFFLGQCLIEEGEEWPSGEWPHGADGIFQYYGGVMSTGDRKTILRFLEVLAHHAPKGHLDCPCASGLRLRNCCRDRIEELRAKIKPQVARLALKALPSE